MGTPIRFENLTPPPVKKPQSEIDAEGVKLDLHEQLRLVGLTFGVEPTAATLGWAAVSRVLVIRRGRAIPVGGLALHFSEIRRFEISFSEPGPGQLDYFELRAGGAELLFHFEGGTLRLECSQCRAELVTDGESGDDFDGSDPGLLQ